MSTIKSVRLQLNSAGFKDLLNSEAVRAELMRRGEAIAEAAGGEAAGFVAEESVAPDRVAVQVSTTTFAARAREARDRTLLSALDAGRS